MHGQCIGKAGKTKLKCQGNEKKKQKKRGNAQRGLGWADLSPLSEMAMGGNGVAGRVLLD